jgi:NADPH:quinone reductase-like Zn-dependent oxidoreductase
MREVRVTRPGSLDGFDLTDAPPRAPAPGEVRVSLRATSLNFRDLRLGAGPPGSIVPGTVPLSDGAGEIAELGPGVTGWALGDAVMINCQPDWISGPLTADNRRRSAGFTIDGMLADQAVAPAKALVRIPSHLSFLEAATLPCAATSAWSALTRLDGVTADDTVLVLGSGGVSVFALQFAKQFGARVIATTSSEAKATRLKALGADDVVNYVEDPNWDETVLALTEGRGVSRVVEVGGEGTIARSANCSAVGARIAVIGFVAGTGGQVAAQTILQKHLMLFGVAMSNREQFDEMARFIGEHGIRPVVDETFDFPDFGLAYGRLKSGAHFGKVAVSMG